MATSHQAIEFNIRGVVPLILHNGRLANPLDPFARAMKGITGKRKKTDEDYEKLADLEWEGGLYLDDDNRVVVPGENIEGLFVDAAKKSRMGDAAKAGLLSDGLWPLKFDGPKTLDALKADPRFRDTRKAGIKGSSVMRTRPIFRSWSLAFTVHFLPDLLNSAQIREFLETGGRIIGLCDYTPKYGRFEVI